MSTIQEATASPDTSRAPEGCSAPPLPPSALPHPPHLEVPATFISSFPREPPTEGLCVYESLLLKSWK